MRYACLTLLAFVSATGPTDARSADPAQAVYVRPAPPGRLVDIGGRRLHVECKGDRTGPAVIFEAGLSQYTAHATYGRAQDLIAPFAWVCTYDRAGLGWSDPVQGVRSQADMVRDLHRLIGAEKLKGPLVLVGHSMGGLLVRLYAHVYPGQVAALVLVDSSSEAINFSPAADAERKATIMQIDAGLKNAKPGVPVVPFPYGTPADLMMAFTPEILRTVQQEEKALDLVPAAMRVPGGYGKLGAMPLAVIRRGRTASPPSDEDTRWRTAQEALTGLSTRSFMMVATNSGHVIPYEEPQVVADAVRRIVAELATDPSK